MRYHLIPPCGTANTLTLESRAQSLYHILPKVLFLPENHLCWPALSISVIQKDLMNLIITSQLPLFSFYSDLRRFNQHFSALPSLKSTDTDSIDRLRSSSLSGRRAKPFHQLIHNSSSEVINYLHCCPVKGHSETLQLAGRFFNCV